ncbi:DUF814 domain-containing protein [Candidatus Woesearchaeota archaeon]|nr:DUF814 domain-containing protein [Candidatus Woesearchaeota archaeon]
MKIELEITKSLEENASVYFDKSKKNKKKVDSISKVLDDYNKKLLKAESEIIEVPDVVETVLVEKLWYEKFHWFFTSEGFLAIGGRDATTNEIIIKKHTDSKDLVFHTDMAGSPFFVIKSDGKDVGEASKKEVATAVACYSKAWKRGIFDASVFYVNPDQVSKTAQTGEFLPKGAFMIRGKTNYVDTDMKLSIGLFEGKIIGGPIESISSKTENYCVVIPGTDKTGAVAKQIFKKLKGGDLDDIIRFLPAGGSKIVDSKR